ncbi:MAG TPA: hypothetical protein VF746_15950 [Longimicrobium sp.]|jgi:hypothetical protein
MKIARSLRRRLAGLLAVPALALSAACDNPVDNTPDPGYLEVVLNSVENSLTIFPAEGPAPASVRTIGLGPQGSPVGLAARGSVAVVPMGVYPFAAVVDLGVGAVLRQVPLPANSGATGAAFVTDRIAVVANPNRNTVSPIDVVAGTASPEVAVGTYPQAVASDGSRVYVVNANLVNFSPAGPGSVTVLTSQFQVVGTAPLTGLNPSAAVIRGNRLYVLNSGRFGQGDGSLSVVDLATLREERLVTGFGEFPGSLAVGPDGNLYVGVYGTGVLVWDPDTRTFVRGLNNPLVPGGSPPVSAVAFDANGKLHTTNPGDCRTAGAAHRLTPSGTLERTVATGICPFAIAFATVLEN